MPSLHPLPVDAVLPQVIAALRAHSALVLEAETGAGKTTRVAPALLHAGLAGDGAILLLQPRRIAARAAAQRMAEESGTRVGDTIGYQVRFDRKISRATRIHVITDGVLIRRLQEDATLEGVAIVIFDEFHERSLNVDLALGMVQRLRQELRPELKVVLMSATLDVDALRHYLDDGPAVKSAGRLFDVEVEYQPARREVALEERVRAAVESLATRTSGDVLAFLPGVGEIRRSREALESFARSSSIELHELYGDLPLEQQNALLQAGKRRRVVLSTNVAETSLTIENVTAVVDSGLVRRMHSNPALGIDSLEIGRISKASAAQRAGRAGRVAPGICVRLWSELDQRSLEESEQPEIRRVDLAGMVLLLLDFGERDFASFPFLEAPPAGNLDAALRTLETLGAAEQLRLTRDGAWMARLPVHPRIARLVLEGARRQVLERAALAAALLAERDPFLDLRTRNAPAPRDSFASESDLLDRVQAVERFERTGEVRSAVGELHQGGARRILDARDQLLGIARAVAQGVDPVPANRLEADSNAALLRCLLAAYPDRVARRRKEEGTSVTVSQESRGVMVGGRGVRILESSRVRDAELFLCIDVDQGEQETLVRKASAVRREWLEDRVSVHETLRFNAERRAVESVRRSCFLDLVLDERQVNPTDPAVAADLLARAASENLPAALPLDDPDVERFRARARCLARWMPELGLPAVDDAALRAMLPEICAGRKSFDELRRVDLPALLRSRFSYEQLRALDRYAPERIEVPSGSQIRLEYRDDGSPVLAVRIQEVFGLLDTPAVAGGRIPVLMHLLAPNQRVQQITQDLRSFWNTTYQQVRKDLRARYPKHSWPENPLEAEPTRRTTRRRS